MEIQVRLEYKDKVYLSNKTKCTDDDVKEAKNLIKQIAQGKITYLSIESDIKEYYFTKQVLEKSILTVIVT